MNIRTLMKDGSVWLSIEQNVEAIYAMSLSFITMLILLSVLNNAADYIIVPLLLLLVLQLLALSLRLFRNSLFVIKRKHESNILESLKISQVEMANGVKPDAYRELYDRILEYFESEKPFLNSNLTINDVVKVVFSNKSYISRVISLYTGRNFRQFVNYYRVAYAVGCFRNDPSLKITQMSSMSGFNSIVSFNMAFRLFMGENPSDWCRKERIKILKKKK